MSCINKGIVHVHVHSCIKLYSLFCLQSGEGQCRFSRRSNNVWPSEAGGEGSKGSFYGSSEDSH